MTENMKKFLEAVSKNEELAKKLNELTQEDIVAAAKELGIELTEADFAKPANELNDDELDAVAGGLESGALCLCAAGGGGKKDDNDKVCACVLYGMGKTQSGDSRCSCYTVGHGSDT